MDEIYTFHKYTHKTEAKEKIRKRSSCQTSFTPGSHNAVYHSHGAVVFLLNRANINILLWNSRYADSCQLDKTKKNKTRQR